MKLLLLTIPREVMEQQAAARRCALLLEPAYLEAKIEEPKKLTAQVALKGFVIPNTELIPEDVRSKRPRSGRTTSITGRWTGTSRTTLSCRAGWPS